MDLAFLVYLYETQDWHALVTASRQALFEGRGELAELTLAASYARVAPDRAEPLLLELADGPQRPWALLQLADTRRDDPWQALAWLDVHEREFPGEAADWRRGAEARLRLTVGDWDGAAALLPAIDADLRRRSPLAGAVSSALVPGLGQAIAGQRLEGASALLVVSSLAVATVWAARSDRAPTALAFGLVGGLFWTGNLYGGADAAVRFNRARASEQIAALDRIGLSGSEPPPLPVSDKRP